MKLIFCPRCQDVRKLSRRFTSCECGASWGAYEEDGYHAIMGGDAIPLGFNNQSLSDAILLRPQVGMGQTFEAFVIPVDCSTIEKVDD